MSIAKIIQSHSKRQLTQTDIENIMVMLGADIKFNRVNFGNVTNVREFERLTVNCLMCYERACINVY